MAIMAIMTIKAVPPYGYMAINVAKLGFYLKVWENVDHLSALVPKRKRTAQRLASVPERKIIHSPEQTNSAE